MIRFILTSVAALAFVAQFAFAQLAVTPLTVKTDEATHAFTVEIADTEDAIREGLMFRESLAPDAGMLFDFQKPRIVSMWMKDTYLPLDMIFIDADGVILNIVEHTVPQSLVPIVSKGEALAVLEVNAGTAGRLGVKAGDRVRHPIFGGIGG